MNMYGQDNLEELTSKLMEDAKGMMEDKPSGDTENNDENKTEGGKEEGENIEGITIEKLGVEISKEIKIPEGAKTITFKVCIN